MLLMGDMFDVLLAWFKGILTECHKKESGVSFRFICRIKNLPSD